MTAEYDNGLGQYYDPSPRSKSVPSPNIEAGPLYRICINAEWASFISGVIDRLVWSDVWDGPDEAKQYAAEQIKSLQAQFNELWDTCIPVATEESLLGRALPVGALIDWPDGPTIPEGFLALNGQAVPVSSYPDLAAAIPAWVDGANINLPVLNGTATNPIFTAGTASQAAVGTEIGANTKPIENKHVPPHDHFVLNTGQETILPRDAYNTSGNRFSILTTAGVAGSIPATASDNTGANRYSSESYTEFNVIPKTYLIKKLVCAIPQFVTVAEAGPEGPAGPRGEDGENGICLCAEVIEETIEAETSDPPEVETGVTLEDLDRICGGATRIATQIVDDIIKILDYIDAAAAGIDAIPDPLTIAGPVGWLADAFSVIGPLLSAEIRAELDQTFIEDLACEIYCCIKPDRTFNSSGWACFTANYPFTFGLNSPIPTSVDDFVGGVVNARDTYAAAYRAYTRGVADKNELCRSLCSCSVCADKVALTNVNLFDNPDVTFSPEPEYYIRTDGQPAVRWPIDTEVRVILAERQCVRGINVDVSRGATESTPNALEMIIADQTAQDGFGGFGTGDADINFPEPIETSVFVLRVPDGAKGSTETLRMLRNNAIYKRYD